MHVKIAALVQTSKWPPSLDAGATGTPVASHFFIARYGDAIRCREGEDHALTKLASAHHTTRSHWRLSLAGLAWPGPLARQEPGAEAVGKAQGSFSTNM